MSNARKPQNAAPKAPNSAAAPPTPNTAPREKVSPFTCPECNGTLWEVHDKQLLSFRCRVGHAYSEENMEAAQATSVERALWAALRALEERAALERGLAEKAREQARSFTARRFEERAAASECNAEQIRAILHKPFDGEEEQPSEPGE
jgi:two-component system chemotaxis response regulator CheB